MLVYNISISSINGNISIYSSTSTIIFHRNKEYFLQFEDALFLLIISAVQLLAVAVLLVTSVVVLSLVVDKYLVPVAFW